MNSDEKIASQRPAVLKWVRRFTAVEVLAMVVVGLVWADWWTTVPARVEATFVGQQTCTTCHQDQAHKWRGSHHDLAMQVANDDTVLGDFKDATQTHHNVTSRMFRRDGKFMINTEGPDGKAADFEIKYVFGVEPLQQYMVEFDRPADMPQNEIARLQVLRVSWDTEKKEWIYIPPPDVAEKLAPDDELHWTGIQQRWNTMCADCHSTNLQKNFDVETATYHTTFTDINVSCEACHGPGSVHIKLAKSKSFFWDRKRGYGLARLKSKDHRIEIETCAMCHSRRSIVHPNYAAGKGFYNHFTIDLLEPMTYHADGQIMDEDYVYGSFIQSKMYHKGIRCSDCHDSHTTKLKHPGNKVCTSCHEHPAGKYDVPAHHHHKSDSTGASCVECHMPETTYMEVDPRRDHSLRVPRPDLSVTMGLPNSCTRCHLDRAKIPDDKRKGLRQYQDWIRVARTGDEQLKAELNKIDAWAAKAVKEWYGHGPEKYPPHFARALHVARNRASDGEDLLIDVAKRRTFPDIARAAALSHMRNLPSVGSRRAAIDLLDDPSVLVRLGALRVLNGRDHQTLQRYLPKLLNDKSRTVRIETARILSVIPKQALSVKQRASYERAFAEMKAGAAMNNDRAAPHISIGVMYQQQGKEDLAVAAYKRAMRVEPRHPGPRTNLAAIYDARAAAGNRLAVEAAQKGNTAAAEAALSEVNRYTESAKKLRTEELALYERDARLAPNVPGLQYRYGLSLYLHDRFDEAEAALLKAYRLDDEVAEYAQTLALFYQRRKSYVRARRYAERWVQLDDSPTSRQLLATITGQAAAAARKKDQKNE